MTDPPDTIAFPLRLDQPAAQAAARDFFQQAGFTDATVCRVLGIDTMADLGRVRWDQARFESAEPPLRWCLEVFVRGRPADYQESLAACGGGLIDAFQVLGLLRTSKLNPAALVCPVWLYPVDGLVLASDRRDDPDGCAFAPAADVVFPAIYGGTLRFLRLLPAPRGESLDLCGGSGIGALHLAKSGQSAVTADIAGRSALFAEFNSQLNAVPVTSLCGDLYEPVRGRRFQLITAHPPFVPAIGQTMIYRDGGDTGDAITRRIIEGLAEHLEVGGTCVILCVAPDAADAAFEQRVRHWLGADRDYFDVVFGVEKTLSVDEVVDSICKRNGNLPPDEAPKLRERLHALGARQFAYGALFLRRSAEVVPQSPLRIGLDAEGTAADFDRLLAWRRHARTAGFADWLADSTPRLAPRLELTVHHLVQNGQLIPAQFVFAHEAGFRTALRPDGWVVPLIARLEGAQSVRQVFETAARADELPAGFTLPAFLDLVERMIERGFLEVDFPR